MKWFIVVAFIVASQVLALYLFVLFSRMREELGAVYPEKLDWLFGMGWHFIKFRQVWLLHKATFPDSKLRKRYQFIQVLFFSVFAVGAGLFLSLGVELK